MNSRSRRTEVEGLCSHMEDPEEDRLESHLRRLGQQQQEALRPSNKAERKAQKWEEAA